VRPERQQLVRSLFDEYIEMYAARDDRLTARFSENFSGYTGSGDFLVKAKDEWVKITRLDFSQVTGRIRIEMLDVSIAGRQLRGCRCHRALPHSTYRSPRKNCRVRQRGLCWFSALTAKSGRSSTAASPSPITRPATARSIRSRPCTSATVSLRRWSRSEPGR